MATIPCSQCDRQFSPKNAYRGFTFCSEKCHDMYKYHLKRKLRSVGARKIAGDLNIIVLQEIMSNKPPSLEDF